ncbi:MAG: 3-deoxy-manno-octulosonate cytidylyltransferase [Synergistaceae bacterium]|nr:3-deoxy-manno-octulosonate cytidylyltransferase [Synergistaceae bacterium]
MRVIGVIPARYNSSRLPGKPIVDICGHPMIWWVYQQASKVKEFSDVLVAADDGRIKAVCDSLSIPVIMTSDKHKTAANRLQEVSETVRADFYVQINGDEPLIDTRAVSAAIPDYVPQDTEFGTNIITEMTNPEQVMDSSNIKVVFDCSMNALYMSRIPIPYPYKSLNFKYYKHVGIIGCNKKMLDFYRDSEPGRFELVEGIDTLRFLDYGKQLKLSIVSGCRCLSVDTEKDLEFVTRIIEGEQ